MINDIPAFVQQINELKAHCERTSCFECEFHTWSNGCLFQNKPCGWEALRIQDAVELMRKNK